MLESVYALLRALLGLRTWTIRYCVRGDCCMFECITLGRIPPSTSWAFISGCRTPDPKMAMLPTGVNFGRNLVGC